MNFFGSNRMSLDWLNPINSSSYDVLKWINIVIYHFNLEKCLSGSQIIINFNFCLSTTKWTVLIFQLIKMYIHKYPSTNLSRYVQQKRHQKCQEPPPLFCWIYWLKLREGLWVCVLISKRVKSAHLIIGELKVELYNSLRVIRAFRV